MGATSTFPSEVPLVVLRDYCLFSALLGPLDVKAFLAGDDAMRTFYASLENDFISGNPRPWLLQRQGAA